MEASGLMGIRTPSRFCSGAKNLWDEFALQGLHCAVTGIGTGTWSADVPFAVQLAVDKNCRCRHCREFLLYVFCDGCHDVFCILGAGACFSNFRCMLT